MFYSTWEDYFGKRFGTISFFIFSFSAFWAPKSRRKRTSTHEWVHESAPTRSPTRAPTTGPTRVDLPVFSPSRTPTKAPTKRPTNFVHPRKCPRKCPVKRSRFTCPVFICSVRRPEMAPRNDHICTFFFGFWAANPGGGFCFWGYIFCIFFRGPEGFGLCSRPAGSQFYPPPLKKITYAKKFLRNYFRGDCDGFA